MRKLILLPALVLTLGLAFVAPVAAAPENNPQMREWTVTCGSDTYTGMAKGVPGWIDLSPGTTPSLYMGGTHYWLDAPGGDVFFSFQNPIPPGMAEYVTACRIEGYWAPDLYIVIDPAYLLFTPHA